MPLHVRSPSIASIEASEPWEREALGRIIATSSHEEIRSAAAHAIGAFASFSELFEYAGLLATESAPALRREFLWALQLTVRPAKLTPEQRTRCEAELRRALRDPDPWVRRRAAYVAGDVQLGAWPSESERADLRVAALVGLGELCAPAS